MPGYLVEYGGQPAARLHGIQTKEPFRHDPATISIAQAQRRLVYAPEFENGRSQSTYVRNLFPNRKPLARGHVVFVGGQNYSAHDTLAGADRVSRLMGGIQVGGVFNLTHGAIRDTGESGLGYAYVCTPPTMYTRHAADIHMNDPNQLGDLLYVSTSQGSIHTRNALIGVPENYRSRIQCIAVSPGAFVWPELCQHVVHLESSRDFVPKIDSAGRKRSGNTIVTLLPHPNAPSHDHSFFSPTMTEPLIERLNDFIISQRGK